MKVFLCSLHLAETTFMLADERRKRPGSNLPKEHVVWMWNLVSRAQCFISLLSLEMHFAFLLFFEDGCCRNSFSYQMMPNYTMVLIPSQCGRFIKTIRQSHCIYLVCLSDLKKVITSMLKIRFQKSQIKIWERENWGQNASAWFIRVDSDTAIPLHTLWINVNSFLMSKWAKVAFKISHYLLLSLPKTSRDAVPENSKHCYFFSKILSWPLTLFVLDIQVEMAVLLMGLLGKTWLLPLEYLVCRTWPISCLRKEHEDRLRSY